jgi:MFS family permease
VRGTDSPDAATPAAVGSVESVESVEAADNRRRVNLAVLVVLQALYLFITSIDLTLTGIVGLHLAPTPSLATLPFALISVAGTLSTAPASLLMARFGRRVGFMLGAAFAGIGGLVSVRAISTHDFVLFCAGTAFVGLNQGFAVYFRYAAADDALPDRRPRAISAVLGGGVAAAVAGPFVATAGRHVLKVEFAGSYLLTTALATVSIGLLFLLRIPRQSSHADESDGGAVVEPARPLARVVTQRVFLTGVAGTAVGYFVMMLLMTAAPISAVGHHHTVQQGAMVVQWHLVGMFAPSLFSGRIVQRYGAAPTLLGGVLVAVTAAVVAMTGTSQAHFLVSLGAVGVGWNLMQVSGTTLIVQSYRPSERARTQATAETCTAVTAASGSLCAGYLLDHVGWAQLNVVALVLLLPTLTLTISYLPRARAARRRPVAVSATPD